MLSISGFSKVGLRELAWELLRTWIWPPLITLGSAMIGYFQGVPIFYLCVGGAALFSFVATALLRYTEWCDRIRVEWKLATNKPLFAMDNETGFPIIGVQVSNSATFPIECEFSEIETQINYRVPKIQHNPFRITVQPNGIGWYYAHPIEIEPPTEGLLTGSIRYRVMYGSSGKELELFGRQKRGAYSFQA